MPKQLQTALSCLWVATIAGLCGAGVISLPSQAATYEIHPATADADEEFERLANALKPGDELVLHGGEYSQEGRRAVAVNGTADAPIVIRAAEGQSPLLTRPADQIDRYNNIEFVDCSYLVIRGIRFRGGNSGVRFIRGHHITFEDCEVFETGNNALTMNSGSCDSFIIRRNHLHHTGLSTARPAEGEGMYIGCHNGSCITTNTLVEGNYIHHLRSTSEGGNDGIEIKVGSYGNTVRGNVIHDTNIGRRYPGIFVYGGGPQVNIVEGNTIWNAGEGIQVVSDAIVRNNIIYNCSATGITAAPHAAVRKMRNVTIVNNTLVNHPTGVRVRWSGADNMVFANNAVYCPGATAVDASGIAAAALSANYVEGRLAGATIDDARFLDGGTVSQAFTRPEENQFQPRPGSLLIGHADGAFVPERDFSGATRTAPYDVGAYESGGPTAPIKLFDLGYTLKIDANNRDQVRMAWDHCHAVAALQGLVNRQGPTLYLRLIESQHRRQNLDDFWLEKLSQPGQWLHGRPVEPIDTITDLVREFRSYLRGLVVYDPNVAATSNVASTVAGAEELLPVRYDPTEGSLYRLLKGELALPVKCWLIQPDGTSLFTGRGMIPGTDQPSTGSAKCDAYLWMKLKYLDTGRCNGAYGAYYLDQYWIQKPRNTVLNHHCLTNHDFFIARNAFFFDLGVWGDEKPVDDPEQELGTDLETLKALLLSAYHHGGRENMIHIGGFVPWAHKYTTHGTSGGHHDPVPTEWEYGKVISAYNGFMDADAVGYGAMANASFFMHYPLRPAYPQKWVTREDLTARGYLDEKGRVKSDGREFLIFYVGDYDCAAWLYQRMMDIWDDPARGQIPLMWCISPVLERRAPMAMDYLRRTATPNDYFAAADNGAGYCEPGMLQETRGISHLPSGLDAWARHCKPLYDRWGLSITGFIIYAHGPALNEAGLDCYASFSGNGIVPSGGPASLLHGQMPVLRFDHDVNEGNPAAAARHVVDRVVRRRAEGYPPFHWFRNILKTPTWYVKTYEAIRQMNPRIELLDAPTFFELYRIYLENQKTSGQ